MMNKWVMIVGVFVSFGAFAQDDWEGRGEIQEAEVVIEKDRKIVLPTATRVYERMPQFTLPTGNLGLDYTYLPVSYVPEALNLQVRPLTVKGKALAPVKIGNVKLGYGNYQTPLAELSLGNGRNDEFLYNLFVRHRSSALGPVDEKNSGDGSSQVDLRSSIYLNEATFSGGINFELDKYTFYGYNPAADVMKSDIEQSLTKFYAFGLLEKNDPQSDMDYDAKISFDYVKDKYDASEGSFGVNLHTDFAVNEELGATVLVDFYLMNRKDAQIPSYNRNLLRLKPYATYELDRLTADLGVSMVMENDTLGGSKGFRLFPYLNIDYSVSDYTQVFLGFAPDVEKNTLKSFLAQNRYLSPNVDVFHDVRVFDAFAGLRGQFASNWSYEVKTEFVYYKNRAFFINDAADTSKFEIVYDTGSSRQNSFMGSLGYDITKAVNVGFLAEYFFYSTENVQEAWHLPRYNLELDASFLVAEKFKFLTDAYVLGGIQAFNPSDGSTVELPAIINLGVGFEYLISNSASVFVNGYNILGDSYQRYLNYTSRELQIIGGLSFSF